MLHNPELQGEEYYVNQDQGTRWRPTTEQVVWIIVGLAGLGLLVFITYLSEKSLWDLVKILAVPLTIGGAVPVLNRLQKDRELAVEETRAQDQALQAYLDQMGELVVKAHLRTSRAGAEVRVLARARTLTVL